MKYGPDDIRYHILSTIEFFRHRHIAVLLIGQVPHYHKIGGLPVSCVVEAIKNGLNPLQCGISEKLGRAPLQISDAFFTRISHIYDGVSVFTPTEILCKRGHCSVMGEGKFLYRDPGHLSKSGARYLSKNMKTPSFFK